MIETVSTSRAVALAARLALGVASSGIALLAAELALRMILPPVTPAAEPAARPGFLTHDARLGWVHVAGSHGVMQSEEFDVTVAINDQGIRGPRTYALSPRPDVARIVVVGDSFSFGYGVRDEENWITRLEQNLAPSEVINLAVTGYGTDQQLLRLEAEGLAYAPNLVVVALFEGNVFRNAREEQIGYPKPRFEVRQAGGLELVGVPVPEVPEPPGLLARSALGRLIVGRGGELFEHLGFGEAWPITSAILGRMRTMSLAAGAELVVVVIPKDQAVHGEGLRRSLHERTLREIDRLLGDLGILHLDLTPSLVEAGADERLYFLHDGHWNAAGHAVAAKAATSFLRTLITDLPDRSGGGSERASL